MARSIKTVVPPLLRSFRMYSARIEPAMAANMTATNTRRIFNEEHDMVRETARRFFNEQVLPYHDDWERQGRVPREIWQAAGAEGLLGAAIPEKYGGAGMDKMAAAIVWEEQAYASVMGPGFSIHSGELFVFVCVCLC